MKLTLDAGHTTEQIDRMILRIYYEAVKFHRVKTEPTLTAYTDVILSTVLWNARCTPNRKLPLAFIRACPTVAKQHQYIKRLIAPRMINAEQ